MTQHGPVDRPTPLGRLPDVRVAMVEDHALLASALGLALGAEGADVAVVALLGSDAVLEQCVAHRPHVVLLDLDLGAPTGDGTSLVAPLVAAGCRVVILTGSTDDARLAACLEAGASGLLPKTTPLDAVVDLVGRTAKGEEVLPAQRRHDLLLGLLKQRREAHHRLAPFEALTDRERDVLGALVRGSQVEDVTRELFITETTVRTHVRGILHKLEVRSQLAAVARAHDAGWEPPTR